MQELNPSEKIWQYIKQYYKNKVFATLDAVKQWRHKFTENKLKKKLVKSIPQNAFF